KYLYIDGTLFSSGTNATDSAASISVIVAAATNQQVASWPGKLDEIRSYNRALSGTEINALWLGKQ
ncbi:MAG: LamG-like jellyroll fold domain-containing protein, partial [Candidatus Ratteibacteria bacterium]